MNNEKMNSKIKLSNNSSFLILKFRVGSNFGTTKCGTTEISKKIANIKIPKDKLFDNFIFELYFSFFRNHLNTQNI